MIDPIVYEYARRAKKRTICFIAFLLIFFPAMYIKYIMNTETLFGFDRMDIVVALQISGLIPILWSIKYSKCPACNKNAGYGWRIKQCAHCGKKLV